MGNETLLREPLGVGRPPGEHHPVVLTPVDLTPGGVDPEPQGADLTA